MFAYKILKIAAQLCINELSVLWVLKVLYNKNDVVKYWSRALIFMNYGSIGKIERFIYKFKQRTWTIKLPF